MITTIVAAIVTAALGFATKWLRDYFARVNEQKAQDALAAAAAKAQIESLKKAQTGQEIDEATDTALDHI